MCMVRPDGIMTLMSILDSAVAGWPMAPQFLMPVQPPNPSVAFRPARGDRSEMPVQRRSLMKVRAVRPANGSRLRMPGQSPKSRVFRRVETASGSRLDRSGQPEQRRT